MNVVQGGIERPPVGVYLNYRFLGARVPQRWREWVRDDITRPHWQIRQRIPAIVVSALVFGIPSIFVPGLAWGGVASVAGLALGALVADRSDGSETYRQQMLAYQLGEGPAPYGSGWTFRRLLPYLAGGLVVGLVTVGIVLKFFS